MDGAALEPRFADERLVLDEVERALLLARHAESDNVAGNRTLQLRGRAFGDDLAVVDDRHAVGQCVGLVEVMGGEKDGGAAVVHLHHLLPNAGAALRIETRSRLVEEEQLGVVHQALPDVADPLADPARLRRQLAAGHSGGAAARRQEGGEHTQGGGLPRAVRSEEAEDLAPIDDEVHARHRLDLPAARLEYPAQTARLNNRFRLCHPVSNSPGWGLPGAPPGTRRVGGGTYQQSVDK